MADCDEAVYSNNYFDWIVEKEYLEELYDKGYCMQMLDEGYGVIYDKMPDDGDGLQMGQYSYGVIPKCFGLLNNIALDDTGIIRVRDQPNLSLTGRGVLIGFIDTEGGVILLQLSFLHSIGQRQAIIYYIGNGRDADESIRR